MRPGSKGITSIVAFLIAFGVAEAPARAGLAPTDGSMTERPGAELPLDSALRDERGGATSLRSVALGKPTILALAYYRCPNLCTLVFNGLVDAFAKMRAKPGTDFNVVSLSFDPRDTPELARMKKRTYLAKLGIADEDSPAWRFLTGTESGVRPIADAIGFHYAWDPTTREYAHPAGIVILTPEGKVDRYFAGIRYDGAALEKALRNSGHTPIRASLGEFFLTCLHYDPRNSERSALVLNGIRALGAASALGMLAGWFFFLRRRRVGTR